MKTTLVYKNIEWLEVGDEPTEELILNRNKTCPRTDEKRWMRNYHSYINASISERVWLLYQPGLSLFNGWEDHPEELDNSALVEVEVLKLQHPTWAIDEDEKFFADHPDLAQLREEMESSGQASFGRYSPQEWKGWAKVRCLRVVPFAQIPESFPVVPPSEHSDFYFSSAEEYRASAVTFYSTSHQEAREWWVITHGPPRHLVLFCLDVSDDPIEVWNWLLPD